MSRGSSSYRAPDLISKPAGRRCCCRPTGHTDGQTDTQPFYDAFRTLRESRNNLRETAFLNQRISVEVQRFRAVCHHTDTFISELRVPIHRVTVT